MQNQISAQAIEARGRYSGMYLQLIQNICQEHNHYLAMLVNLYLHVIQERQIQINQREKCV